MLPIIAAAARAAAAGSKAAKAAKATKAARAAKASDSVYNARRRYVRKAERYMKQAETVSGAARDRYMHLAKNEAEKALSTYEKEPNMQKLSKGLQRITAETGARYTEPANDAQRRNLVSRSEKALESNISDRREYEGRAIMSSSIGSRVIASFEPIWRQYAEFNQKTGKFSVKDWDAASKAIFEHVSNVTGVEVNDWLGVIEQMEKNPDIQESLYKEPKNDLRYDAVVQAAQVAFKL